MAAARWELGPASFVAPADVAGAAVSSAAETAGAAETSKAARKNRRMPEGYQREARPAKNGSGRGSGVNVRSRHASESLCRAPAARPGGVRQAARLARVRARSFAAPCVRAGGDGALADRAASRPGDGGVDHAGAEPRPGLVRRAPTGSARAGTGRAP